ncbi:hypothetical protein EAE96_001991 [Botrytis aclada]|nr:hypothetical protein EAE96_001991 [Botrytis aclada]
MTPSTEEDNKQDMLDKDELVVSKEVRMARGRQIIHFRRTFEHLHVSKEKKKDHTTSRSTDSSRSSRRNHSFYEGASEVPPVKQEKASSTAPKSHKSTKQQASQAPAEQEHPIMPPTQENLSAVSKGHNSQAGPRTHKSSHSNPDIERNGVRLMKSTDGDTAVKVAPCKKSNSRAPRVISLYSAGSDPGLDPDFASQRSDVSSSNSGGRSSTASSISRSSDTGSLSRSKNSFHLNVGRHNVNVRYGSGRTHPAPSSDDDKETIFNIKIKESKRRSRPNRTAGIVV